MSFLSLWRNTFSRIILISALITPIIVVLLWITAGVVFIHLYIPYHARNGAKLFEEAHPHTIPVIFKPTYKEFYHEWVTPMWPVIMKNLTDHWPARRSWDAEYLADTFGRENEIPVQWGNIEQSPIASLERTSWDKFTKLVDKFETDPPSPTQWRWGVPYYAEVYDPMTNELWDDVDLIRFFPLRGRMKVDVDTCLWVGPKGAITGLHSDPDDINVLFHLKGRKKFHLSSPLNDDGMYISDKWDDWATISDVDPFHPNLEKYPKFRDTKWYTITLEPGDALYIPPGWWHYAEMLSSGVSISARATSQFTDSLLFYAWIREELHKKGIYPSQSYCTCHTRDRGLAQLLMG